MPEDEALLDIGLGAHKSYVFGRSRNTPLCSSLVIPVFSVISHHEWPYARTWAILEASTIFFGGPSRFPRLRARARPACTRSLSRTLSCFAIVARMEITACFGPSQSVELGEGFEDAFAGEAIERPKQERGIAEHFLELNAVTVSARLAVGVFAGDRPTLLCGK